MRKRCLFAVTTMLAGLAAPAFADPIVVRLASKDLLTTNPQDVAHIERIEAALAAKGKEIDIQILDLPSSGYADALTAQMLAGDIPDLIYFQGGDAQMAEQGVLTDLRPYIEASENIKEALWPQNAARLENYPYLLYVYPPRNPQPVIRKSWLEQAGMDAPTTLEGYQALFTAIRDGDFDGNGQADSVGLTSADTTAELDSIFNRAFGIDASWLKDESGAWIRARVSPQEREKITWYAALAADGLYDKDYVTTKWDLKEDKFYTGRAGVIFGSSAEVIDIYGGKVRQLEPDAELVLLAPPSGPGGQGLQAVDTSKETRGFAISALAPDEVKQAAFDVLDFVASPEGQKMERMGFEGTEYTTNADGSITFAPAISTWYVRFINAANWQPPGSWMSSAAQGSLKTTQEGFVPDNAFVFPAEFAPQLDATENVYREWMYKFISGNAPLSEWDTYVAEWNAAGGTALTDYARSVLP